MKIRNLLLFLVMTMGIAVTAYAEDKLFIIKNKTNETINNFVYLMDTNFLVKTIEPNEIVEVNIDKDVTYYAKPSYYGTKDKNIKFTADVLQSEYYDDICFVHSDLCILVLTSFNHETKKILAHFTMQLPDNA